MIRSAKMKLITPPKLMPPFQSTAARGTFPTEQTKLSIEITGPMSGLQNSLSVGWSVRKNACHQLFGTQAASAPAMRNPSPRSTYRAFRSMKKECEMAVNARGEKSRDRNGPSVMDMSISPCASWVEPKTPRSAWRLASSTIRLRSVTLNRIHRSTAMSRPPANSAATNCQPKRMRRTRPSSKTRLVEANSKMIALTKLAPLRKSALATATAA